MYEPFEESNLSELWQDHNKEIQCLKGESIADRYYSDYIDRLIDRKITNRRDLPEWFNLQNYEELNELDDYQLYIQIATRAFILDFLSEYEYEKEDYNATCFLMGLDAFKIIMNFTVVKEDHLEAMEDSSFSEFILLGHGVSPIREITLGNLRDLSGDYKSIMLNRPHQDQDYWKPLSEIIPNDAPYDSESKFFSIDMKWKDDLLIEAFSDLLKKRRREELVRDMPYPKKPRWLNYQAWIKQGVIPYFDLAMWARLNRVHIPHRVFSDAVFSDGDGGESNLENTTIKNAELIFTRKTVMYLQKEILAQR